MNLNSSLTAAFLLLLVAVASAIPEKDEEILRSKRSPDNQKKIEKLQKKLVKAQIKEAKKHGGVHVVPVVPVPSHVHHHSAIVHPPFARVPLVHVSRHRRTPGAVSKVERKIVKAQVKRIAKKESKKVLKNNRHKRDSHHKKIEKLERKLVKEQHKQLKKDIKKGRVVPHYVAPVVYHPQPVYQATYHKKPKGIIAKAKSYIG